jgi:hypothetical protein
MAIPQDPSSVSQASTNLSDKYRHTCTKKAPLPMAISHTFSASNSAADFSRQSSFGLPSATPA